MDPNSWRIIQDPLCDGSLNMATDQAILLACNDGKSPATLRLYGWKTPTLSVGYSQDISKHIDLESCERNNIPVVRRFTGGRALLHHCELTYSLIAPIPHPAFPGNLRGAFGRISQAVVESLKIGGIDSARVAEGKKRNSEIEGSPACFSMSNHCEIVVQGKKLVGSAQRRLRSAFLQHGSVVLDADPQLTHRLLKYSSEKESHSVLESLILNTVALKDILQGELEYDSVTQWFVEGFQRSFSGDWKKGKLTMQELEFIEDSQDSGSFKETIVA